MDPLFTATSHDSGVNAVVNVYPDRLEWHRKAKGLNKALAAIVTLGLALLFPLDQKKSIPIGAITNVEMKREGPRLTRVVVSSRTFGRLRFRLKNRDAEELQRQVYSLISGGGSALAPASV